MFTKKAALVLASVISLSACSTMDRASELSDVAKGQSRKIDQTLESIDNNKVVTLKRPPQLLREVDNSYRAPWLDLETKMASEDMPLTMLIKDIVGQNIKITYGDGVDPNKSSSIYFEGTKEEALNILALNVDYGISVVDGVVKIDKFITKTYELPTTIGENSFQIGSNGSSSGGSKSAASGEISTTGSGDGQFANVTVDNYNLTKQIHSGIEKILNGEATISTGSNDRVVLSDAKASSRKQSLGYAKFVEGVASIVVRTSPAMMLMVDDYVNSMVDQLTKLVALEVVVLEYQQDEGTKFGADIDATKKNSDYSLNFDLSTPSLADAPAGFGLGFAIDNGSWKGTTGLINALKQTGDVSVNTTQRVTASNHMIQEIDLSAVQTYFSKVSVTYEGTGSDRRPTTSTEDAEVRDGVKMLVVPNIKDDKVYLKLNGVLSKVLKLETQKIANITVTTPRTRQARFNISGAYEYNKPFVVAHMRQETNEGKSSDYLDVTVGNSAKKEIKDTLVILTPRRVHANSIGYR